MHDCIFTPEAAQSLRRLGTAAILVWVRKRKSRRCTCDSTSGYSSGCKGILSGFLPGRKNISHGAMDDESGPAALAQIDLLSPAVCSS